MNDATEKTYKEYVLPPSVVEYRDVTQLIAEAEELDAQLTTQSVHEKIGVQQDQAVHMSDRLTTFLEMNNLAFEVSHVRTKVISEMRLLKQNIQNVHMTFASEPDQQSLRELLQWFRANVSPQVVVKIGVQPALVAGVYMRTANHVYDFSLRNVIGESREYLIEKMGLPRG